MKILLVEDDSAILRTLSEYLEAEGYEIETANDRAGAQSLLRSRRYDLALLDITLRAGSGFDVCAAAKEAGVPVIFLTASADEGSVVRGLDMGAEDYIAKPFRPRELLSRIKNVLRRYASQSVVTVGDLTVDTDRGTVRKGAEELTLSALEYRLLLTFINNRGLLLSRSQLLEDIWDIGGDYVNDNTLTVYIKRLREKIEDDPQNPAIIRTVRGLGYRMD